MSSRKTLHVVCHLDPKYGGTSTSVPGLAEALARTKRYTATVLGLCEPHESYDQQGTVEGYFVRALPFGKVRPWADWLLSCQLRGFIAEADVVLIHGLWRQHCWVTGKLASELGKPLVVSAHGMLEAWALRHKRIRKYLYSAIVERRNLRRAACLRALTLGEAEDYRRYGLRAPVAVIPNGIEVPNALDPESFWSHYPGLRGRRVILFLGRLHYKKGLDVLCRAWAIVARKHADAHLVLAGPDWEGTRCALERLIGELGLEDTVTFTGVLKGKLKWGALAASESFVLPSYSEGFSVATLEAMAAGKPVIISRQCYFPEVAREGCGWVIEPCEKDLADALLNCLSMGKRELSEMGERGQGLVRSRYSWDRIGKQMADVCDWLLGGPKPTSVEIID